MIIMALDHTRDFFRFPTDNPTDLATTSVGLFLTRVISHFCAPVFFLLMGTSAWLAGRRKSRGELSQFLLLRGVWLIFLEVVVVRCLGWQFNFDYHVTELLVLWALGGALIALAAFIYLPRRAIVGFGLLLIVGHNLFDGFQSTHPVWAILHGGGYLLNKPGYVLYVGYPLIPWIGVTAVGYGLGPIFEWDAARRQPFLFRLGVSLCVAFVVLRGSNLYGDPAHWVRQDSLLFTGFSWLNTTKYPPSLLFLLMTLGPTLIGLAWADRGTPRFLRPALVFGKVPLFFYLVHFFLIHLLAVGFCLVRYGAVHWMFESPDREHHPFTVPPGWGYSLPVIYLIWGAVVVSLYPLCRWFADLKQKRRDAWLSYL
ncbi:MAG: DUF1624 domain-containing protein [Planctomycetes bacterium]|nr:DUF1624 domain-containing protein [Planctomycetota bacterium]